MSAALKLASLASGLTLVGYSTMHMVQTPQKEFSQNSLALDHTLETPAPQAARPKLPSNFVSFTIGKYEFKNAA